jgi:outer membrane protein assembly factor BamD
VEVRIEKARNILAEGDYMIAEFYYKKESYQSAVGRLESMLTNFPDYKKEDEALLLLGKSYRELRIKDKAKDVFERLITKYPTSKAAKEAKKLLS